VTLGPSSLVLCSGTIGRDTSFRDRLAAATDAGYDAISLWGRDYARARSEGHSDGEMRTMLDDHGLVVAEVDPAWWWTPGAPEIGRSLVHHHAGSTPWTSFATARTSCCA
jgi:sugar phosphate isomerase/epimerase